MKRPKAIGTVFLVENDEAGRAFIKRLRSCINRAHYALRVRGRNPDRQQFVNNSSRVVRGYQIIESARRLRESIPNQYASYFAVYIDFKGQTTAEKQAAEMYGEIIQLRREKRSLESAIGNISLAAARTAAKAASIHARRSIALV